MEPNITPNKVADVPIVNPTKKKIFFMEFLQLTSIGIAIHNQVSIREFWQ